MSPVPAREEGTQARTGDASRLEVRAELDVPGETGRQARIFAAWGLCLLLAVIVASVVGAHVSFADEGMPRAEHELSRSRADKAKAALLLGLVLPALLTWGLDASYRRGGRHARGIVLDVTDGGELRLWGRSYGVRVELVGAQVSERLVDVYAGRLGAWRQRRLRVKATHGGGREIEIATTARASDVEAGLRVDGGEGDCVELARDDFDRVRALVLEVSAVKVEPLAS